MTRCPLKLILFGEHSVLKGGSCLSVSIKKYCEIIDVKPSFYVTIIDQNNSSYCLSLASEVPVILNKKPLIYSTIRVNMYFGCGLGTSASVSLLLAYLKHVNTQNHNQIKPQIDKDSILRQALIYENYFHFKSSGVDVLSCFYGGLISFQTKIAKKIDLNNLDKYKIIFYDSKISKKTSNIVQLKMKDKERNIGRLVEVSFKAHKIIENGFKLEEMYKLIREAQDVLEDLGLVPSSMKDEVRRLRKIGIESKISGAGCGGHLFTFVPRDMKIYGWFEIEIERIGFIFNID